MKKINLITQLCITIVVFSSTLFGMQPWEHPAVRKIILENTAPQTALIKKSFMNNGGMENEEIISQESFKELTEQPRTKNEMFTLAVPELANGNFQFYDANNLANHFMSTKKDQTPTRSPIKQLFIYTYYPASTDKDFPFEYQKIVPSDRIQDEFTSKYTSIDPTESLRRDIQHLQSLPQNPDILHDINVKKIELITLLKSQPDNNPEIFSLWQEILRNAQQQAERNYAEINMIEMLLVGQGQPNNRPNYPEITRLCNDLISSNLQFNADPESINIKYHAIDLGRFYLAELARLGFDQPNNKPNIKEALRLYNLITRQQRFDHTYFKTKLTVANIYNRKNDTRPQAKALYTQIIQEATQQARNNNPVDQAIILEAQANLKKIILQSASSSSPAPESEID